MAFRIAAVLLAVPWLGGCSAECVTEGCDALRERARGDESGIGGVVASSSDVVTNGCHECGFGQTTVEVFEADGPLRSAEEVQAAVTNAVPLMSISASGRYSASLEPGTYLVCVGRSCIDIAVTADAPTTVNIKLRYGPTSFFVIDENSGQFVEDFGIELER